MMGKLIVTTGVNGWGNRKVGTEAYGPMGRWKTPPGRNPKNAEYGDLLGDHLDEIEAHEGSPLIIVTSTSRFDGGEPFEELTKAIEEFVADWEASH